MSIESCHCKNLLHCNDQCLFLFPCLKKTATSNIVSASCSSMILVIASPAIMSTPSMFHYRYCFLFLFPKPPRKVCSFCLTECCDIFVFLSNQLFVLQFLCPFLTCIYQTVSYHSYTLVHNHLHQSKVKSIEIVDVWGIWGGSISYIYIHTHDCGLCCLRRRKVADQPILQQPIAPRAHEPLSIAERHPHAGRGAKHAGGARPSVDGCGWAVTVGAGVRWAGDVACGNCARQWGGTWWKDAGKLKFQEGGFKGGRYPKIQNRGWWSSYSLWSPYKLELCGSSCHIMSLQKRRVWQTDEGFDEMPYSCAHFTVGSSRCRWGGRWVGGWVGR